MNDGWSLATVPSVWGDVPTNRIWYGCSFVVPEEAHGRRVALTFDLIGSSALVYINGKKAGTVAFPASELDVTPFVRPGAQQELVLDVRAEAEGETVEYNESRRSVRKARDVKVRGLTGDVWLDVMPSGARLDFAWAETSVARGEITFRAETQGLATNEAYEVQATIVSLDGADRQRFAGTGTVAADGTLSCTVSWRTARLWDLDTPRNRYACRLAVLKGGALIDETVPFVFGFCDVRIDGRDLLLNGSKVHLRALYDRTQVHEPQLAAYTNAALRYAAAKALGFNAMIAGNYHFAAGASPGVEGLLTAADDAGFLYCFTLPHFKDFDRLDSEAGQRVYRETTRRVMRLARRHPSVVLWATSHNAAGYLGAGHPQRIDGLYELPVDVNGANRRNAHICRRIIGELDPTRPCYHHESGNLDDFHCVNCYLNWSPIQERSEWLEHWSTAGVKPVFFVEWGLPHVASWSSYRGPQFIWRTRGYMSLWAAEYAAALRGDVAYEATTVAREALAREERQWRRNPRGFAFSAIHGICQQMTNNYLGVQARFAADNWRSLRAWGATALLPWDQRGIDHEAPLRVAFDRWNQPDCAWIGGAGIFTDKRHVYAPGETVEKTLVILNDRRKPQMVRWSVALGDNEPQTGEISVGIGERAFVPVRLTAPTTVGYGALTAEFRFADGVTQQDRFALTIFRRDETAATSIALIDRVGQTRKEFVRLGITFRELGEDEIPGTDVRLVVGRESLTRALFDRVLVPHARRGGRVVVFEQTKETLESLGFRVQTYGLRDVFVRSRVVPDWLRDDLLRDWAGASTLARACTPLSVAETQADADTFAGFPATRVWRNGFRGAVASVLPEKPSYGDWLPWTDGGFDLQYAPLLEGRFGRGSVVFCQLDVTGRSEPDVVADALVKGLAVWRLPSVPNVRGAAEAYGLMAHAATVFSPRGASLIDPDPNRRNHAIFLVSSGAGRPPDDFAERVRNGATALLLGLNADEIEVWSPVPLKTAVRKGALFSRIEKLPPELDGLSNADWAWHGLMDFTAFVESCADGNEAVRVVRYGKGRLVFWQVPPWQIDAERKPYLRTSKRHAEFMLSRLMGNLGFRRDVERILYADVPIPDDDPYRYYHW